MELIHHALDFILHVDKHLKDITLQYGTLTYAILFLIIFCETGLVVTPFLPGDSLLFAVGVISADPASGLNIHVFAVLLIIAAVTGNMVNYQIGRVIGPAVFNRNYKLLRKDYLDRAHGFYEKHGGKTIVYSRFIPIIRTFAPFVAGIGKMKYRDFSLYNLAGGALWVILFLYAGFFFGNNDFVKKNFSVVIVGIICISLLPVLFEAIKAYRNKKANPKA